MTRTTRRKLIYFGTVGGGSLAFVWVIFRYNLNVSQIVLLALLFLVPGRILGFFWKDLLIGLRLLNSKQYEESARHSQDFLDQLKRRPWIKNLIWLGTGTYSRDAEAMALNNLGAAELCQGKFGDAEKHLEASRAIDAENPLPYVNLAKLHNVIGDSVRAEEFLSEARRLGYTGQLSDRLIRAAQSRFASTDGHKPP